MVLLQPGNHESLKAAAHGAMGILAAVFSLYNAAAWWSRRQPHLAINAILYVSLTLLEVKQLRQHVRRVSQHGHSCAR